MTFNCSVNTKKKRSNEDHDRHRVFRGAISESGILRDSWSANMWQLTKKKESRP